MATITKEADVQKAKTIAEDFWMEARVLVRAGHPVVTKKLKSVAELVLRDTAAMRIKK